MAESDTMSSVEQSECQAVCEALLTSLLGRTTYERWINMRKKLCFHRDSTFANWLLDIADKQLECGGSSATHPSTDVTSPTPSHQPATTGVRPPVTSRTIYIKPATMKTLGSSNTPSSVTNMSSQYISVTPSNQVKVPKTAPMEHELFKTKAVMEQANPRIHNKGKAQQTQHVICLFCDKAFKTNEALHAHLETCVKKKKFLTTAKDGSGGKTMLLEEDDEGLQSSSKVQCRICGEWFEIRLFQAHAIAVHSKLSSMGGSAILCKHCDYATMLKTSFISHLNVHIKHSKILRKRKRCKDADEIDEARLVVDLEYDQTDDQDTGTGDVYSISSPEPCNDTVLQDPDVEMVVDGIDEYQDVFLDVRGVIHDMLESFALLDV